MNTKQDQRPQKRRLNRKLKRLKFGMYFENCAGNPARVDLVGWWGYRHKYDAFVEGVDLVTGAGCSCSLIYCDPQPLTCEQVHELIASKLVK